ncbi:LacI family DNA-binding transcriptional regulator [Nonomuraea sp. B10E15]|uniref:LacI family DNA-binding transcriptional regulator n=1 Tax=Nonomuraea sp. B10E15 TaxID=3153560 RepID=UPI00325EB358
MAVSMHDVARAAGVSQRTVSNVVNNYEHVRPETRQRVLDAMAMLGYVRFDDVEQARYRVRPQCSGLRAGGEADSPA